MQEPNSSHERTAFERAAHQTQSSFVRDFVAFLGQNKKWWLLPIVLVMAGLGVLALVGGTALAPFIYTLF
jgi:fluoride ion exporter CrcB/FEX